ncbi:unnamed protein product, partial [Pleuronectes platessa]
ALHLSGSRSLGFSRDHGSSRKVWPPLPLPPPSGLREAWGRRDRRLPSRGEGEQ